jgi:hypothetical protein
VNFTVCKEKNVSGLKGSHKKPHIVGFHLYGKSRMGKSTDTEIRLVIAKGWGEGRMVSDC